MSSLFHFVNLSCKSATEMVEKSALEHFSIKEKIQLKFHLTICKTCRSYQKQSEAIDLFFKQNSAATLAKEEHDETPILKNNIINHLNNL